MYIQPRKNGSSMSARGLTAVEVLLLRHLSTRSTAAPLLLNPTFIRIFAEVSGRLAIFSSVRRSVSSVPAQRGRWSSPLAGKRGRPPQPGSLPESFAQAG